MKKAFDCPLCGGFVVHKELLAPENSTHAYSCKECPFMALEAYNEQNIKDLLAYFQGK